MCSLLSLWSCLGCLCAARWAWDHVNRALVGAETTLSLSRPMAAHEEWLAVL